MTNAAKTWRLIDSQEALEQLADDLKTLEWVALDTEFMREKTFHPELCLLQLASPDWAVCVDPLADLSLQALFEALYRPGLTKVLHAAEQDLELLHKLTGRVPADLFDTQIAAPLLGFPEQVGYGRLVEMICGRALDKSQTRTDWSRRPLSEAQLQYAADDVIELVKVYQHLNTELRASGRDEWLRADWQQLADPERFNRSPDRAWERLKGLERLSPKSRGAAQHLAIWREHQALDRNRPRNWIIKDATLLDIAKQLPRKFDALSRVRGLPEPVLKRDGKAILQVVNEGLSNPQPLGHKALAQPLNEKQEATVEAMIALVRLIGEQHQINPHVLASKKSLEKYLRGETAALSQGWRGELLRDALDGFLAGTLMLRVRDGELHSEPHSR